jgi:hypothetical protein
MRRWVVVVVVGWFGLFTKILMVKCLIVVVNVFVCSSCKSLFCCCIVSVVVVVVVVELDRF